MSKNIAKITDRIILKLLILCKVPLLHPKWAGASRILCKQRNLPRLTGVKVRNNHQEASNEGEAKQWRNEGLRWPFPSLNHPPSTVTSCPPSLTNIRLETATLAIWQSSSISIPPHLLYTLFYKRYLWKEKVHSGVTGWSKWLIIPAKPCHTLFLDCRCWKQTLRIKS